MPRPQRLPCRASVPVVRQTATLDLENQLKSPGNMSSWASNVNAPVELVVDNKKFVFENTTHRLHIAVLALSLFLAVSFYPLCV
jgi:hypothetical protein